MILLLAVFAQIMDALTFVWAYDRFGITGELNPVAVYLYGLGGIPLVLLPKLIGVILVCLGVFALAKRGRPELAMTLALALGLAGLLGWGLNVISLLSG